MTRVIIAIIITLVWAASYVAAIFSNYHPPVEVNGIMLLVGGYFFGTGLRKVQNGDSDSRQK